MPMLPAHSLVPLALFTAILFDTALFALAALGHFPRAARNEAMTRGVGTALLWISIVLVAICIIIAVVEAWRFIPWFAAIIAGGVAILIAPLALQYFSDEFIDGRRGLTTFTLVDLVLTQVLLSYTGA